MDLPFDDSTDPGSALTRAAQPVLDRLAPKLADTATSVVLADANARIVDRRTGDRGLRRRLDAVCAAPGFSYSEDVVGTNGLGTVAEERRPVRIVGDEHFVDRLSGLTCVGVPVWHPTTGRLEGILDLTCRVVDTSPLMLPMVLEAAREIEQHLYEQTSVDERLLLEGFLAAPKRSSRPLVSLNEQIVIANPSAARLLSPADHVLLHGWATGAAGQGPTELRLAGGATVTVQCQPVAQDQRRAGALIEFTVHEPPPASERRDEALSGLAGNSQRWRRVCAEVVEVVEVVNQPPVLLVGEPGVGKLALACAAHEHRQQPGALTVADAALVPVEGLTPWLAGVRSRLADPTGTLVLRHLDALEPVAGRALAGLMDEAGAAAPRLIGTMTAVGLPNPAEPLILRFRMAVTVPALRDRLEDMAELVAALVRRHAPPGPDVRFAPEAIHALGRSDWPGNVRQLEGLVHGVLAHRASADVGLDDLPPAYRLGARGRTLTTLERLERDAILAALADAGGNKAQAVARLGISRATLYRRIRSLGISSDPSS